MRNLLNDLLLYSRVKNNTYNFDKKNLSAIILEVIDDFKEIIKEKNAKIEFVEDCKLSVISFQFKQVIKNLFSNSFKFSDPNVPPHIIINCKVVKGHQLKMLKLSSATDYNHITISDNGIGFDPEYKERIFEVFQRLYSSEIYEGTGIGLAICKKIVENHNGVITAMSELNKGARFDIYIPVEQYY